MPRIYPVACCLVAAALIASGLWYWRSDSCASESITNQEKGEIVPTISKTSSLKSPSDKGRVTLAGKYEPFQKTSGPELPDAQSMKQSVANHIREVGPEQLSIGKVALHKVHRTISFPATFAERDRPIEYALVHSKGKVHEALLQTDATIQDLHVATLLMNAVGQKPKIELLWSKHGGQRKVSLADLVTVREKPVGFLSEGHWHYNGSRFMHGTFTALREGSIIALMNDPSALINHPKAGSLQRDDVFFARREKLPPVGVQVSVILTFPPTS